MKNFFNIMRLVSIIKTLRSPTPRSLFYLIPKLVRVFKYFKSSKKGGSSKNKKALSTLELLFVVAILSIISAIAIPKIYSTRTNAKAVAIATDIQAIVSSIQEYALMNDINPNIVNASWLMKEINLSPSVWAVVNDEIHLGKNGVLDSANNCITIRFNQNLDLLVNFTPIASSSLCTRILSNFNHNLEVSLQNDI